jgi:hypothetical protein
LNFKLVLTLPSVLFRSISHYQMSQYKMGICKIHVKYIYWVNMHIVRMCIG